MEIIVIGGGASGMMAAIEASRGNNKVTIIEKNNILGKKLLATGNGRCNFTNTLCNPLDYFGREDFVSTSFDAFGVKETLRFFRELGVLEREESEGRVYPFSNQGSSVLEALRFEIESLKIKQILSVTVKGIRRVNEKFLIQLEDGREIFSDKIILATGGSAGPFYGSTGDGFGFAKRFGHSIRTPRPALTKLICKEAYFSKLKGVRARGKVTICQDVNGIYADTNEIYSDTGEIQFTENGISGICVFNISRYVQSKSSIAIIDFFPEYDEKEISEMLYKRKNTMSDRPVSMILNGLINSKIVPVLFAEIAIDRKIRDCKDLEENTISEIVFKLKNWKFRIIGTSDFNDAQTTVGGVNLIEVSKDTMESKLVSGLFFCGELLDIDAKCGGYNLQWAWTSGYVAGKSCGGK